MSSITGAFTSPEVIFSTRLHMELTGKTLRLQTELAPGKGYDVETVVGRETSTQYQLERQNLGSITMGNQLWSADLQIIDGVLRIKLLTWNGRPEIGMTTVPDRSKILYNVVGTVEEVTANGFLHYLGTRIPEGFHENLLRLAIQSGLQVPQDIADYKMWIADNSYARHYPLLSWLLYPMVMESKSFGCAKNSMAFESIWQRYGNVGYKELVKRAFGSTSPKLLKSLWRNIFDGRKEEVMEYAEATQPPVFGGAFHEGALPTDSPIFNRNRIENTERFSERRFRDALAVFKSLGFDRLYQFLDSMGPLNGADYPTYQVAGMGFEFDKTTEKINALTTVFDPGKLVRLLATEGFTLIEDTVRMLTILKRPDYIPECLRSALGNPYMVPKTQTLKELHDKLSRDFTTVEAEREKRPIELYEWEEVLDGFEFEELKFVVAKSTTDLALWGGELKNCVASYGDKAANKRCTIVAVYKSGVLSYCIELRSLVEWSESTRSGDAFLKEKWEGNFVFWERKPEYFTYNNGDAAGVKQLVSTHNSKLPQDEFDRISKVVYSWYDDNKQGAIEWLQRKNQNQVVPTLSTT